MTSIRNRAELAARRRRVAHTNAVAREVALVAEHRPFQAPPCARCGVRLCDERGEPRWEVVGVGTLAFVCLGGCRTVRRG